MAQKYFVFLNDEADAKTFIASEYVNESIPIALTSSAQTPLIRKRIAFRTLKDYDIPPENLVLESVGWIKDLGKTRIYEKKTFRELFVTDNGLSIWFLLELWLSYDSRLMHPYIGKIFEDIRLLNRICRIESKSSRLLVFDDNSYLSGYLKQLKTEKKIVECSCNKKNLLERKAKLLLAAKYSRWTYRKFISSFFMLRREKKEKIKIMGFSPCACDYYDGRQIVRNDVYKHFADTFGKEYQMSVAEIPTGFELGFPKKPKNDIRYFPFEKYLLLKDITSSIKQHKQIKELWHKVKKSPALKKYLQYNEINIYNPVMDNLSFFFEHYLLSLLIELKVYERMIKSEKPKAIILFYASCLVGRLIVHSAKKERVITTGIPHGLVMYGCELNHLPEELNIHNKFEEKKCPIPDVTCVGGVNDRAVYLKGDSYKKEWLASTGYLKYDIYPFLSRKYNRKKTLSSLGLKDETTILFASQPLAENSMTTLVEQVGKALDGTDYQLIVKLHPMENSFDIHKKIFKKYNIKKISYIKDKPILEVLNAVDLVISPYSTVLTEGAALKKPFIILELFNSDYSALMGSDKILVAKNAGELKNYVESIFNDLTFKKRYLKEMDKIVKNQFGTIDGKAAIRIVSKIKSLIAEKNK